VGPEVIGDVTRLGGRAFAGGGEGVDTDEEAGGGGGGDEGDGRIGGGGEEGCVAPIVAARCVVDEGGSTACGVVGNTELVGCGCSSRRGSEGLLPPCGVDMEGDRGTASTCGFSSCAIVVGPPVIACPGSVCSTPGDTGCVCRGGTSARGGVGLLSESGLARRCDDTARILPAPSVVSPVEFDRSGAVLEDVAFICMLAPWGFTRGASLFPVPLVPSISAAAPSTPPGPLRALSLPLPSPSVVRTPFPPSELPLLFVLLVVLLPTPAPPAPTGPRSLRTVRMRTPETKAGARVVGTTGYGKAKRTSRARRAAFVWHRMTGAGEAVGERSAGGAGNEGGASICRRVGVICEHDVETEGREMGAGTKRR